jgi:hypothetical protein
MMQNVARIDWKDYTESIPGILDHRWHSVLVFNFRRSGARIYELPDLERIQRSRSRNQLAHLPACDCARGVFRLCAKPNGLAQISSGSGPSDSESALALSDSRVKREGLRIPIREFDYRVTV